MANTEAIVRDTLKGRYEGYCPQEVHELMGEPFGWESMKVFQRIPKKIGYFFKRELIEEMRRFRLKDSISLNRYFIRTIDGRFFEVIY